jgi:hypothetical protein
LNDPVTRMRFLQGKGQVEGISLSSMHRRSVLEGLDRCFLKKDLQRVRCCL